MSKELTDYLRKAFRSPLFLIHRNIESTSDKLFLEIKNQIPKPPPA